MLKKLVTVELIILIAVCGAWTSATAAAVLINEVLLYPCEPDVEVPLYENQWVELFNSGAGSADLTGWKLSANEATEIASLPPWTLPAGAFLKIHWGIGTDDNDFSDGDGHHYLQTTSWPFDMERDECGLYSGELSAQTISDFINWDIGPSYTPGAAHALAVAAGIWPEGEFFNPQAVLTATTVGRAFNGLDSNGPGDLFAYQLLDYAAAGISQPANPIQIYPEQNVVLTETSPMFDWQDVPTVDAYQVQVANDPDFSVAVIDETVANSSYTPLVPLEGEVYLYRVRGWRSGAPTSWSAPWLFAIDSTGAVVNDMKAKPQCPFRWQRKDTNLLCLVDLWHGKRPGCLEAGWFPWDAPHPNGPPSVWDPHSYLYCARAAISMINAQYGGNLSQDRISYHYFAEISDLVAGPEGDLGHGAMMGGDRFVATLSWALGGVAISRGFEPFLFNDLKTWFDERGCYIARVPMHAVVISGYTDLTFRNSVIKVIYVNDPARGANQSRVYQWIFNGVPVPHAPTYRFLEVFLQPAPPAVIDGRTQEAAVTTDSDGDGMMNFDEGQPRTFHSLATKADTDGDQVSDKNEVRNYTFHDWYHWGHENDPLAFPDIDGDGWRAENDCDSDNGGQFDGGEDINGNGHNVEPGETCVFMTPDWISINVDKNQYVVGEPVFIEDILPNRPSRTYHANSIYFYELGEECPDKADGSALRHDGSFSTDAAGVALKTLVFNCPKAGWFYLTVDILNDFLYAEPDNWDPMTCWECVGTPTPTPTATPTATLTPTPVTPTVTGTAATATPTPAVSTTAVTVTPATATPTPASTASETVTATITATLTALPTVTVSATATAAVSPTRTPTSTPTMLPSQTPTPTVTASITASVTPTTTPTPWFPLTPTETTTATPTQTPTITATITGTVTGTATATTTMTISATATTTPSRTPTAPATITPSRTPTYTPAITASTTPSVSPTRTSTASPTVSPSAPPTPTATGTATTTVTIPPTPTQPTGTYTASITPSRTPSPTPTSTASVLPSHTPTPTGTGTSSVTPSRTPTAPATATATVTIIPSASPTASPTWNPTGPPTPARTPTPSPTMTYTQATTATPTPWITVAPTATAMISPTPTVIPGDVNGDGQITPADAQLAFLFYMNCAAYHPTPAQYAASDFCGDGSAQPCDGSVTPADALAILKVYLQIPDPCAKKGEKDRPARTQSIIATHYTRVSRTIPRPFSPSPPSEENARADPAEGQRVSGTICIYLFANKA